MHVVYRSHFLHRSVRRVSPLTAAVTRRPSHLSLVKLQHESNRAEPTRIVSPSDLAAAIRRGQWPSDSEFDRCMADDLRTVSSRYWSQLAVAERAASWFTAMGIESVLDIGSGVGKFCVASALASRCRFVGFEHRERLVEEARKLARAFGVDDRVRFEHAKFGEVALPQVEAYYLYNPFGENLFGHRDHLDSSVELSSYRYLQDIITVEDLLRAAPVGTHLLTYNGFGGRVPTSFVSVRVDRTLPSLLRMWRKVTVVEQGEGPFADVD
jgi:hypothetical protein